MDGMGSNLRVTITTDDLRKTFEACLVEFISSTVYTFSAVGSSVAYGKDADSLIAIALANTFAMTVAIYLSAGGYVQPLIAMAASVEKQLSKSLLLLYSICHVAASVVAFLLLKHLMGQEHLPQHKFTVGALHAAILEGSMAFLLILAAHTSSRKPLIMGCACGANILVCWRFTGGYMNPVIFMGAAITGSNVIDVKVYLIAPILGAILASVLFYCALSPSTESQTAAQPDQPLVNEHNQPPVNEHNQPPVNEHNEHLVTSSVELAPTLQEQLQITWHDASETASAFHALSFADMA